ncbi:hypothetical protein Goe26_00510 [Bacillus phage vB_BsuM-Goe26]|nr:hypothetical protein Goe26_00510 [Bacillus phage vB_BsuM-Goe26]
MEISKVYAGQGRDCFTIYVKTTEGLKYVGSVKDKEEATRVKERLDEGTESYEAIKRELRNRGTKRSTTGHRNVFWNRKQLCYIVSIKGEYVGFARELDEAVRMRDAYLSSGKKPASKQNRNGVYIYEVKNGWVVWYRTIVDGAPKNQYVGLVETKSKAEQVREELLNGSNYKTIKERLKNERGC